MHSRALVATLSVFARGRVFRTCSISRKVSPLGVEEESGGDLFVFDLDPHSVGERRSKIEVINSMKTTLFVLYSHYWLASFSWREDKSGAEVSPC
jgi:hypothetical protein